jgi:hypothetical protein
VSSNFKESWHRLQCIHFSRIKYPMINSEESTESPSKKVLSAHAHFLHHLYQYWNDLSHSVHQFTKSHSILLCAFLSLSPNISFLQNV